jgi:hypothetical protein
MQPSGGWGYALLVGEESPKILSSALICYHRETTNSMPTGRSGHGQKLSRKQEHTIVALLTCDSIAAAAARGGVAEGTLHRWLKDAAFQAAYRAARRQVVQHAIVQVQHATGTAVQTLLAVMQDPEATASAKVSAAKTILDTAVKAMELEDLEARIIALEQQAQPGDHR